MYRAETSFSCHRWVESSGRVLACVQHESTVCFGLFAPREAFMYNVGAQEAASSDTLSDKYHLQDQLTHLNHHHSGLEE